MKLKIKSKASIKALSFKDYVIESATQQINRLKDDINAFKKLYSDNLSPRETSYLDEAIAEKQKFLKDQQALIKKYQKIRSSTMLKSCEYCEEDDSEIDRTESGLTASEDIKSVTYVPAEAVILKLYGDTYYYKEGEGFKKDWKWATMYTNGRESYKKSQQLEKQLKDIFPDAKVGIKYNYQVPID